MSLNARLHITTEEAAEMSGYRVNYIRHLVRAGKVKADKKGIWLIDREDLELYLLVMKFLRSQKFNLHREGIGIA